MLRILLELSDNVPRVQIPELLHKIHHCLVPLIGAQLDDCKSRVLSYRDYYVGNDHPENAFVLLTVQLLSGRSAEVRKQTGAALMDILNQHFKSLMGNLKLQITTYLDEMPRENYFKA